MNTRVLLCILPLLLAGCNEGQKFREIHAACEQTVPIAQLGPCLEYGLDNYLPNWRSDIHAGYVTGYISWLSAAGERVLKGELSENDMRYGASELLGRLRTQAQQESQAASANNLAMFFSGLAIMNTGNGYQPPPQTTTLWSPGNRPITCTAVNNGSVINCF